MNAQAGDATLYQFEQILFNYWYPKVYTYLDERLFDSLCLLEIYLPLKENERKIWPQLSAGQVFGKIRVMHGKSTNPCKLS